MSALPHFTIVWREDDDGDETAVTLRYTIGRSYPATLDQPAEDGEIEFEASVAGSAITPSDDERAAWERHIAEHHDHDYRDPDRARDAMIDDELTWSGQRFGAAA